MTDVKTIVSEYLKENGYDGLYCEADYDGCGCHLGDLFPCDNKWSLNCKPGYKAHDGVGWIIQEDKPKEQPMTDKCDKCG